MYSVCMEDRIVKRYNRYRNKYELPSLISIQLDSYQELKDNGIQQVFKDISQISSKDKRYTIHLPDESAFATEHNLSWRLDPPEYSVQECIDKGLTFSCSLIADVLLVDNLTGQEWTSEIYFGELPQMTAYGSFIISGTEKVVITQLTKSPGIYFSCVTDDSDGKSKQHAKIIPDKGTYIEIIPKGDNSVFIQYDRRILIPFTSFLRILSFADDGFGSKPFRECSDEELYDVFGKECGFIAKKYVSASIIAERKLYSETNRENAAEWFFKKNKQKGGPSDIRNYISRRFYDLAAYDLYFTGRRNLNLQLKLSNIIPEEHRTLTVYDAVKAISIVIQCQEMRSVINNDIDHLGNRRTRSCGELILRAFTNGMREMERQAINKLNFILDPKEIKNIGDYLDTSPVQHALNSFFALSELCQFMDQNNPLSELRQKRTVSALGPNGLDRSRAGFDVRDIHHTHYGRLCPVETPEGKNSGLISRLSVYSRRNEYGFLETPYRVVRRKMKFSYETAIGRIPLTDVTDIHGNPLFRAGVRITEKMANIARFKPVGIPEFEVVPYVTDEIIYIDAETEDQYTIAQSTSRLNEYGEFIDRRVKCRRYPDFLTCLPSEIDLLDISPQQATGVSAACIPFLEHDDGHRALMGTNMLSQAVPLLSPEIPLVMTGMERYAALDSAQMLRSSWKGMVTYADSRRISVLTDNNILRQLNLKKYARSNYATCINQKPVVKAGQTIENGDVLADAACTHDGVLALGHNPVVAFLCWNGFNFEDAIVVSEKLIREDKFTSLDIMRFEARTTFTEAGVEEITRDIPRTDPEKLTHLDERGIARIGTMLNGGDIIIGRTSPGRENNEEEEETDEIIRNVFGGKAAKYRDTSIRLPKNMKARVIDVKVFTHEDIPNMDTMTDLIVRVTVAKKRKLEVGDKMSGRHGNKGVVSIIVPEEDMPYMQDGTPVDIVLNPLGVPGRMNVGQILEVWLGWAASRLGMRCEVPVFDSATVHDIEAELARAWIFDQSQKDFRNEAWYMMTRWKRETMVIEDEPYDFSRNTRYYKVLHNPECFNKNEENLILEYTKSVFLLKAYKPIEIKEKIACRWIEEFDLSPEGLFEWQDIPENSPENYSGNTPAIITCLKIWLMLTNYPGALPDDEDELRNIAEFWASHTHEPHPLTGKQWLRDGKTGERFDHPVNVGVMNMIKLHHLAEDKVHARSTGTYSMITQQPLAGKLNKGGQRIGEMEVWALEAYGCAYLLQEMLTIKSDDTEGRKKAGWNMQHGLRVDVSGIPASFYVLVHELMGLGLSLSAHYSDGVIQPIGTEEMSKDDAMLAG